MSDPAGFGQTQTWLLAALPCPGCHRLCWGISTEHMKSSISLYACTAWVLWDINCVHLLITGLGTATPAMSPNFEENYVKILKFRALPDPF